MKLVAMRQAESLPDGEKQYAQSALSAMWRGGGANNFCVAAAILTGGTFTPACIFVGLVAGMHKWASGANERLFWAICADERTRQPELKCTYTTPA